MTKSSDLWQVPRAHLCRSTWIFNNSEVILSSKKYTEYSSVFHLCTDKRDIDDYFSCIWNKHYEKYDKTPTH